jgi:hypothetical protein
MTTEVDPLTGISAHARQAFATVADHLIPAAHGMPSAGAVVDADRLGFVLRSRPDLVEPLIAALRPELGDDVQARLDRLAAEEPSNLAALQLVLVGGYYTDKSVRDLIGYPGQMAIEVKSWLYPPYLEEGLVDQLLEDGPRWRDPRTGQRAVLENSPRSYAERTWATDAGSPEGGNDGRDSA